MLIQYRYKQYFGSGSGRKKAASRNQGSWMGSFLEWDFFLNGIFSWMGSFLEWDLILNGILSWMGSYLESDLFLNQIFSWMRSILNGILSWMGSFLEWDLFLNGIFSWMEYYLEWDLILNGILPCWTPAASQRTGFWRLRTPGSAELCWTGSRLQ